MRLPVLLVNEMRAGGKQHRDLLVAYKPSVSRHLLAPSTKTWTMQKGDQGLDADSRASRVIKVILAQRPTKMLLTFGTRPYDDLCCVLKIETV